VKAVKKRNVIKIMVVTKILVLVAFLAGNQLYIGDPVLKAQDSTTTDETSEDSESQDVVVKRKSYLEDLLTLPTIDTEGLKKEEISRYLNLLSKKRKQVSDRVKILGAREKNLIKLEKSIDGKIDKLQEEMDFFQNTIQKEKDINQERLKRLIEFYKKMTPKKAAPVFEKMDKDLVVALFNNIPKKQTMNILSLMNPEKSVEITEYFGRIRSGKEYEMLKEVNKALKSEFQKCKGLPKD
tara:strand:+ start:546 stop:1262 length:717 start_codon:yes stop_codon:yes gene_type:complete